MEKISPENRRLMVEKVHQALDDLENEIADCVLLLAKQLTERGLMPGTDFRIVCRNNPRRIYPETVFSVSWAAYHRQLAAGARPLPSKPFIDGGFRFHA